MRRQINFRDTIIEGNNPRKGNFDIAKKLIIENQLHNDEIAAAAGVSVQYIPRMRIKIRNGRL